MLRNLISEISPLAQGLMDRFWPGPLTLVLPARQDLPKPLLNASGGIAVRISSNPSRLKCSKLWGGHLRPQVPILPAKNRPALFRKQRVISPARSTFFWTAAG